MGAIAEAGQAKRGLKERGMKRRMASNIFGDVGTAIGMAVSAGKKAKTAKGEFEAGYEEMGGDVSKLEKPGILKQIGRTLMPGGHKGFFQMPEGEYRIDDRMYQAENLRTVGEYAKQLQDPISEASKEMRRLKLNREGMMENIRGYAPGKDVPFGQLKSELRGRQETGLATFLSDPKNVKKYGKDLYSQGAGIGDIDKSRQMLTGAGFSFGDPTPQSVREQRLLSTRQGGVGVRSTFGQRPPGYQEGGSVYQKQSGMAVQGLDFLKHYTPDIPAKGETISKRDARKLEKIKMKQRKNISGVDPESLRGSGLSGAAYDKLVWERQGKRGPDVPMQLEEDYLELGPEFQGPPEAEPEWGRFDDEMWERSRAERDIIDRGILEEKGYFDRSYRADPWQWRGQSPYGSVPSWEARQKFALGGRIPGKDTGDDNLVRAEDDEYILNREAAEGLEREHGKGFLDYVNFEKYPRFQTGGRKRSSGYQEGGEVGQANGLIPGKIAYDAAFKAIKDRGYSFGPQNDPALDLENLMAAKEYVDATGEKLVTMEDWTNRPEYDSSGPKDDVRVRQDLAEIFEIQVRSEMSDEMEQRNGEITKDEFYSYATTKSPYSDIGVMSGSSQIGSGHDATISNAFEYTTDSPRGRSVLMDPVTVKGGRKYQEGGKVESPYRNNVMDLYNRYGGRND